MAELRPSDLDGTGVDDLRAFLDASPSPAHVVATAAARLDAAGFRRRLETDAWDASDPAGDPDAGYVVRGGAIVAWRLPAVAAAGVPFRIVGAHTDSPGLRVKPRPDSTTLGWRQLAVEVYGGVLANSWLDRDLGVAGRVVLRDGTALLVDVRRPLARVPQLAVHLDRDVNDKGLVLDRQVHLAPVWGTEGTGTETFSEVILAGTGHQPTEIAAWELCLYDLTTAAIIGGDASLLASGRLDNQVSCWAALRALVAATPSDHGAVVALFDHEEVGSESVAGASGPLLADVLERIVGLRGGGRDELLRSLARSSCVSADNAHAVHPNYPERHEPGHRPLVNRGPAIKINSNQRYATSPDTAALFQRACEDAGVPWQVFVSRNNMPCGSTIGPLTATRLGIATVDVGVPQLSMHSARELCGVRDPVWLADALTAYLR